MARTNRELLDQIEDGALDSRSPLADVLRKCVVLGGRAGSAELRDWARRELEGYPVDTDLPNYRTVPAPMAIDGINAHAQWSGQEISPSDLPEFARDELAGGVPILQGVGELERLAGSTEQTVKLQHAGMPDLVRYMNSQMDLNGTILSMYWNVSASTIHGVVDVVRTSLVALVAEIRAAGGSEGPTAEAASQAVSVVIHNAERSSVVVNTNQSGVSTSGGGGQSIATVASPKSPTQVPGWVRGPWAMAVGVATIVAGVAGTAVWVGWNPFT